MDPLAFAHLVQFTPDAWQAAVLTSSARRIILNCPRQSGKSTIASLKALHRAYYRPGSTILCISPTERQSAELIRKVGEHLSATRLVTIKPTNEAKTAIEFKNGSRIVSLPASEGGIRGFTASLIIEDEAADVPDDIYFASLPMIAASKGDVMLMGTPKGRRGHFFSAWEREGADWERYKITWKDCPRLDPAEIERQHRVLGALFAREYLGEFLEAAGGLVYGGFDEKRNLIDFPPEPLTSKLWRFFLGVDFGFNDPTALVVLGLLPNDPTAYIVQSDKASGMTVTDVGNRISAMPYAFSKIIGDTLGFGKGYAEELRRNPNFRLPIQAADNRLNKSGHIDLLNSALVEGRIKIVKGLNPQLREELITLPWNESRTKEVDGYDNHLTDAMLYVWKAATPFAAPYKKEDKAESDAMKEARRRSNVRYAAVASHFAQQQPKEDDPFTWGTNVDESPWR